MADLDVTTGERVQNALVSADAGAGAGTLAKVLADIEAAIAAKQDAEATLTALAALNDTPVGTGSDQLCAGNDGRLSNARTPTAHATSHESGGSDPISLDAGDISFTSGSGLSSTDAAAALDELKDLLDALPGSAGENLATATSSGGTDVPVDFDSKGRLLLTITGNVTNFAAPTNLIGGTSVYREHWLFVQASGATRTIAKDAFGATEYNHAGTLDPAADWSLSAGEILPVKITYYHNGTSATVYAELFPPATAVRIDASGFTGNLDSTTTDVQALADAVDGLTVGGGAAAWDPQETDLGDSGTGTFNIDATTYSTFLLRLTGDCTINFTNTFASSGSKIIRVQLLQDGTGGRVPTISGLTHTSDGVALYVDPTANAYTTLQVYSFDDGTTRHGVTANVSKTAP